MGLRNCCCTNKSQDEDALPNSLKNSLLNVNLNDIIKPVFKINIKYKIKKVDFAESFMVKRYKLKHKKRLIVVMEDRNTVTLFSFYLGNLVFLISSFKVNDKYKIVKCCFLSKLDSTRFCLFLEDNEKKLEILIIKIEKEKNRPQVELNLNLNNVKNVNNKEETINEINNEINVNISERNKKAVESIVNSSDSSITDLQNNTNPDENIILRNYDSNSPYYYFKSLPTATVRKIYEDIIMVKYGYYKNIIKLVINDYNDNVSKIKVCSYYIYLFSDQNCLIKCYKVSNKLLSYQLIFSTQLNFSDPFTDLIFPVYKDEMFVIDGLDFVYFKKNVITFKKKFKDLLKNNFDESDKEKILITKPSVDIDKINFIKFSKVIFTSTHQRLKNELKKNSYISNFYISGLCNTNDKSEKMKDGLQNLNQFISFITIDLDNENISDNLLISNNPKSITTTNDSNKYRSKIRILKNIPFITDIAYGPFNNGPLLTGHINGTLLLWNISELTITKVIRVFSEECSINKILNEPLGVTMCVSDNKIISMNLIKKKFEYYYNENENNELERVVRLV